MAAARRLTAILGNNSQVLVSSIAAASGQIKAGKLRALACFGAKRAASLAGRADAEGARLRRRVFAVGRRVRAEEDAGRGRSRLLRETIKKAATGDQFKTAIANIGDEVAYLDSAAFAKFWDEDAKRVEAAVQSIGRVQG